MIGFRFKVEKSKFQLNHFVHWWISSEAAKLLNVKFSCSTQMKQNSKEEDRLKKQKLQQPGLSTSTSFSIFKNLSFWLKNNFSDFKRSRLRLESFLVIQEISLQGSNSSSSSNTSCLLHWKNRFCKHWTLGLYSHGWTLAKGHFISSSFEPRKLYTQSQFSVRKEEEERKKV